MDQEFKKQNDNESPSPKPLPLSIAAMLLASTVAGFAGGWFGSQSREQGVGSTPTVANQQVILNESQLISGIAKSVGESVVSVSVTGQRVVSDIFGSSRRVERESAGTGVIISEDGIIITNRHVVPAGTSSVAITLSDGTLIENVEVIGRTRDSDPLDIAFLRAKDRKLKPAAIGDSSKVQVGDRVVAIGNALGQFQNTVTSGIISGFGRNVEAGDSSGSETLQNLFQTDTAINQGNSGGPLVNINGEVIGINTAVAGGGAENIGFAIPINDIQGLIKSVKEKGKLLRPYLGIRYITLTDDLAFQLKIDQKRGAYIAPSIDSPSVIPGSPAEKAGLKEKDIIIRINDQTLDEKNGLVSTLGKYSVDETVNLTIIRDGKEQTLSVKLEAAPAE